jgi:ABC-type uncharacterized transport system involved in gliding motility auxiliary subunit
MKISYVLWNKSSAQSEIPMGQAWKWILHLEHEIEIHLIFKDIKNKVADGNLTLLNLQIDQQCGSDEFLNLATKAFTEPVIYEEYIPVARIISTHTDADSVDYRFVN